MRMNYQSPLHRAVGAAPIQSIRLLEAKTIWVLAETFSKDRVAP